MPFEECVSIEPTEVNLKKDVENHQIITFKNLRQEKVFLHMSTTDLTVGLYPGYTSLLPGETKLFKMVHIPHSYFDPAEEIVVTVQARANFSYDVKTIKVKMIGGIWEPEEEIEEDRTRPAELKCPICSLAYSAQIEMRFPRLLWCGCALCQKCARKLVRKTAVGEGHNKDVRCPIDKEVTKIMIGETEKVLKKNSAVLKLLEQFKPTGTLDSSEAVEDEEDSWSSGSSQASEASDSEDPEDVEPTLLSKILDRLPNLLAFLP